MVWMEGWGGGGVLKCFTMTTEEDARWHNKLQVMRIHTCTVHDDVSRAAWLEFSQIESNTWEGNT